MNEEIAHIHRRLSVEGEKTLSFFEALSPTDWEQPVYVTGSEWRVREILAHFISAERAYQKYLDDVLQGGLGAPDSLDIDEFNEAEVSTMQESSADLMEAFRQVRQDTLHLTEQLEDQDLSRTANHPWFEGKDVSWYLKLIYRHNAMHRKDIRKAIKLGQPLPPNDDTKTGRQVDPPSNQASQK